MIFNTKAIEQKIVQAIHDEFDTAQDRLLCQAEKLLADLNIPTETKTEETAERLKRIGFVNSDTVKKAELITVKRAQEQKVVVKTREEADTIQYYKNTYPFLKFLTEGELNRICEKYNLIYAPVTNYIKDVPEKNILEIENAQDLKSNDKGLECFELISNKKKFGDFLKSIGKTDGVFIEGEDIELLNRYDKRVTPYHYNLWSIESSVWTFVVWNNSGNNGDYSFDTVKKTDRSGLFIAAPSSHFNTNGLKKDGKFGFMRVFETEVKDPIVFRYVRGGVQVLSKWGLEASDELLVNPINN